MTYAALMVQVHASPDAEPRLRLAADLADQLDAALIGMGAVFYEPPPDAPPWIYGGEVVIAGVQEEIAAELGQAKALFERVCGGVRKGAEWRASDQEPPARTIAAQSRAADLVICGAGGAPDSHVQRQAAAADLMMTSGRPVLTGPAGADCLDLGKIVLAWKDTREARRALADAMPLLARAERVLVAAAPEAHPLVDPSIGLADVAEAIRRHGGQPVTRLLTDPVDPAEAVLEAAVEFDAQLIVAGGYGHTRLREWVFGGVTRHLLRQDAKFVLFSH